MDINNEENKTFKLSGVLKKVLFLNEMIDYLNQV